MKMIRSWNDLGEYGINFLTGEACAVGTRLLCDVNEKGRQLLCTILGLPADTKFAENWNNKVNGEDAVGSIFLPRDNLSFLGAMILLQTGCPCVMVKENGDIMGIEETDEEDIVDRLRKVYDNAQFYGSLNVPRRGLSAVHAMSGRSQTE